MCFVFVPLVDETEENGKKAIDMVDKVLEKTKEIGKKISSWNNTMIEKMRSLRDKITKARQIADGVSERVVYAGLKRFSIVRNVIHR